MPRFDVLDSWLVVANPSGAVTVMQMGEVMEVNGVRWWAGEPLEYAPLAGPYRNMQAARQTRRELKKERAEFKPVVANEESEVSDE